MLSKELNIGRAGQYLTMADLLLMGVQAHEAGEGANYDVIADVNGKLIKIQVKTTQKVRVIRQGANPIYFFHIKRTGKHGNKIYDKNDFDCFALVALDIRKVFYLSFDDKVKSNSICVRDKNIIYQGQAKGGKKNGLYYQELTWENLCLKLSL